MAAVKCKIPNAYNLGEFSEIYAVPRKSKTKGASVSRTRVRRKKSPTEDSGYVRARFLLNTTPAPTSGIRKPSHREHTERNFPEYVDERFKSEKMPVPAALIVKPSQMEDAEENIPGYVDESFKYDKMSVPEASIIKPSQMEDAEENILGVSRYESDPVSIRIIRTKAAEVEEKAIYGLTILDKELFIVTRMTSEVEVYDALKLRLSRRWNLAELTRPKDIASCSINKCLYILDYKSSGQSKEILRVHPNGKLLNKWSIDDDGGYYWGGGLSVTEQSNVILTVFSKNILNEYSPDGQLIREINLSDAGIRDLWYARELTNRYFVACHGFRDDDLHRVCIVDVHGRLTKSFGERCGSTIKQSDIPAYLAVDGNGFIIVADLDNGRVLILDSDLRFKKEILLEEENRFRNPLRIILDEPNGRMLVADNEFDLRKQIYRHGRILILDFK